MWGSWPATASTYVTILLLCMYIILWSVRCCRHKVKIALSICGKSHIQSPYTLQMAWHQHTFLVDWRSMYIYISRSIYTRTQKKKQKKSHTNKISRKTKSCHLKFQKTSRKHIKKLNEQQKMRNKIYVYTLPHSRIPSHYKYYYGQQSMPLRLCYVWQFRPMKISWYLPFSNFSLHLDYFIPIEFKILYCLCMCVCIWVIEGELSSNDKNNWNSKKRGTNEQLSPTAQTELKRKMIEWRCRSKCLF